MIRRKLVVAMLGVFALSACASGTVVPLSAQNIDTLVGNWAGTMRSQGASGKVFFQTSVSLQVSDGQPPNGQFTLGTGRTWTTPIRVASGSASMMFQDNERRFALRRMEDGSLRLNSNIPAQNAPANATVNNIVELTKK